MLEEAVTEACARDALRTLAAGRLDDGGGSAGRLVVRIGEFENAALRLRVRRLERDVSALHSSDPLDDMITVVNRFACSCEELLFFKGVACLPVDERNQLARAVCSEVTRVLVDFEGHVQRNTAGHYADDMTFEVRRLLERWARGGRLEQLC